ncbi:MAG: prolipoprotein diacylglyceryl transferase, partial [Anaerolineae bacterium]|nr:prolipoprotein diacylglyceryl transferase [Anaerolineae bacterium]
MLPDFAIGPLIIRTYSLFLGAAIALVLGVMAWAGEKRDGQNGLAWVDACLWALGTGIVAGRLGHAAIHWSYFTDHLLEVPQVWRGGLDWHTAVAGGLIALAIACRQSGLRFRRLAAVLALLLPLGAALIYTGCWMVSCGHGREVASLADYPALAVAELPDLYG